MKRCLAILSGLLVTALVHAAPEAALRASDARTILPPANAIVQAGYATLLNPADRSLTIIAIDSPVFESADLHESIESDGLIEMRPALPRTLAAGERLVMSPGGVHIMFRNPRQRFHAGDSVPVFLALDNGTRVRIDFVVKERPLPRSAPAAEAVDERPQPYVLAERTSAAVSEVAARFAARLRTAGSSVVGRYSPYPEAELIAFRPHLVPVDGGDVIASRMRLRKAVWHRELSMFAFGKLISSPGAIKDRVAAGAGARSKSRS